jgi:hypothetical protein
MRDLDTQEKPVIRIGQFPVIRLSVQRDPVLIGNLGQFLQVGRPGRLRLRCHADRFGSMNTLRGDTTSPRRLIIRRQIRSCRSTLVWS